MIRRLLARLRRKPRNLPKGWVEMGWVDETHG